MNPLLANKYALMKSAGQHADVCLLNTQDGYWSSGSDFQKVQAAGACLQGDCVSPPQMPSLIRRLTEAGHSVALLDYWSPNLSVRPQPTLILRLEGKEDWL